MGFVLEMKICVGKRKIETSPKKMREKKWKRKVFLIEELIVGWDLFDLE